MMWATYAHIIKLLRNEQQGAVSKTASWITTERQQMADPSFYLLVGYARSRFFH
jgi:hypothetical protein